MQKQLAPSLQKLATLNDDVEQVREKIAKIDQEIAALAEERQTLLQGASCVIKAVTGETRVHTLRQAFDAEPLALLPPRSLRLRLHQIGDSGSRLFSGSSGSFEWRPPTGPALP